MKAGNLILDLILETVWEMASEGRLLSILNQIMSQNLFLPMKGSFHGPLKAKNKLYKNKTSKLYVNVLLK